MTSEATLEAGEHHPSAKTALDYVRSRSHIWSEAIYSSALSGNRAADICASTLRRLKTCKPVSDRYIMGLAWFIYELENNNDQ